MKCPKCDSPAPHLHPAMQSEGEVSICDDDFHKQPTSQNRCWGDHHVKSIANPDFCQCGTYQLILVPFAKVKIHYPDGENYYLPVQVSTEAPDA
jgi:hypothetical protein